ncbi:mechanosensitive ion channel family protein [Wohlfahrtiimonas chitiniclastica]|uniref:mechanosensitive ion channel family protein n=1 Tax=Wohlfahrtiimonas chitiniclastica TaxID=400946 RepID=UPI0007B697E4|nr:mechanosensitive ion channel family protein [Wohlfahrtiimonas chitiniclastica]KZX37338.1 mechanosensitive ion channel protein MscS [Wohlfahrtiimonas chitiniclastica]
MITETLLMKYAVGGGIICVGLVAYLISAFCGRRFKDSKKGIISRLLQSVILCGVVLIISQYVQFALVDFKLHFISAATVQLIAVFWLVLIITNRLFKVMNRLEKAQVRKHGDPTSARIINRVLKIIIFGIIVLMFGEHFGLSLSGLLAFGGIGGIAIGMAGKDILSNFFSGIMLYFDRPFNIGDWVSSPDRQIEGTVVEVGWRITKIMTFDHRPLYVPNAVFSAISVENPGRMTNRRIKTELGLRYDDADKVGDIVNDIRTMLQQHPKIDATQTLLVYFNEFADSSLNIMIYCFTKTTVWAEWLEAQQEVYLEMISIVHKHGADFAFPTQTLYMQKSA